MTERTKDSLVIIFSIFTGLALIGQIIGYDILMGLIAIPLCFIIGIHFHPLFWLYKIYQKMDRSR